MTRPLDEIRDELPGLIALARSYGRQASSSAEEAGAPVEPIEPSDLQEAVEEILRRIEARRLGPIPAPHARGESRHVELHAVRPSLLAIAYPDRATAERVRDELARLTREHVIEIDDAVVVTREPGGKVKLHKTVNPTGVAAASGALWGGLIGLIFLAPLLGAAISAAGATSGALTDLGIEDNFMKELGTSLPEGGAALFVLMRRMTPDKVIPQISQHGGKVLQTSLSREVEQDIEETLADIGR